MSIANANDTSDDGKRYRAWCFTLNNYLTSDIDYLLAQVPSLCRYITFGEEVGENGTPHLQGFIYFSDAKGLKAIKKKLSGLSQPAHWGRMISTADKCIAYCHKGNGTADAPSDAVIHEAGQRPAQGVDDIYTKIRDAIKDGCDDDDLITAGYGRVVAVCPAYVNSCRARHALDNYQYIPITNLRNWQRSVLNHLVAPHAFNSDGYLRHVPKYEKEFIFRIPNPRSREILWIWSKESETGKTTFMDSISRSFPRCLSNITTFKLNDILQPTIINTATRILWFNITRQVTDEYLKFMYITLETLSDRVVLAGGKYGGSFTVLDSVFIVVTANVPPEHQHMGARMVEICVDDLGVPFTEPAYRDTPRVDPRYSVTVSPPPSPVAASIAATPSLRAPSPNLSKNKSPSKPQVRKRKAVIDDSEECAQQWQSPSAAQPLDVVSLTPDQSSDLADV